MFDIAVACLVLTALLAYINHRFVGLPTTIGVMVAAMLLSFSLVGLDKLGIGRLREYEQALLSSIDFSEVLMQGMLSLLLFAGALHVDLGELRTVRRQVGSLAVFGTLLSSILVGFGLWYTLPLLGVALSLPYCLVFGTLISPTDPIAVMGVLKSAGAPKRLESLIAGESLFNDGVGVVLFSLVATMAASGEMSTIRHATALLVREAGGGILLGLALGYVCFAMLRSIDSYQEEVLITLAIVLGGYEFATFLHVSGPLAMVVVGLVIGNHGRALAMSEETRHRLDMFWEMLDELLNAILFVLIGMQVVVIPVSTGIGVAAAAVIAVTLAARVVSVAGPMRIFGDALALPAGSWKIVTWGGLRGGISVALALSLRAGPERDLILALTYSVVVFSVLCQGLTMGHVVRITLARAPSDGRPT